MPEANVEKVIEAYARYNAGDRIPQLDYWHEDAEFHASSTDPDTAAHKGIAAIREQFKTWEDAYPDLQVEPLEVKGSGASVFVWVRFVGHGAASGVPIDMHLAHVHTFRGDRVARLAEYSDRAQALEAAGLQA